MKVLIINGSAHKKNTTWRALDEVARTLESEGIETEFVSIGADITGCMGCGFCKKNGQCVRKDIVNEIAEKLDSIDGFIVGSPTYYASPSGSTLAFLDRLFYSAGKKLNKKPAAAVVVARRGGTTAALDVLNKYFAINEMPVISSTYWNMVHGFNPEDAEKDEEGLQCMRNLARNMAWILKAIDAGKKAGIEPPQSETSHWTHFIR